MPLPAPIVVTGECDRHLGAMKQVAAVKVAIFPSEEFDVLNEAHMTAELRALKFPEYAIFGFLDVVMTDDFFGTGNIRIVVKEGHVHPIDSSPLAFREAGRAAGKKFLQLLRPMPLMHNS